MTLPPVLVLLLTTLAAPLRSGSGPAAPPRPPGAASTPDQRASPQAAIKGFLVALADSVAPRACTLVYIHPEVGDSFYTLLDAHNTTMHVLYRLSERRGEVIRRGLRQILFAPPPLHRASKACLAFAAMVWTPTASADSMWLMVEVLRPIAGHRLVHLSVYSAQGSRSAGIWRFVLKSESEM